MKNSNHVLVIAKNIPFNYSNPNYKINHFNNSVN